MDSTAVAPRGQAIGTSGKPAGRVRICSTGSIGSQVLLMMIEIIQRMQFTDSMEMGRSQTRIENLLKIESVPPERVLHEETV